MNEADRTVAARSGDEREPTESTPRTLTAAEAAERRRLAAELPQAAAQALSELAELGYPDGEMRQFPTVTKGVLRTKTEYEERAVWRLYRWSHEQPDREGDHTATYTVWLCSTGELAVARDTRDPELLSAESFAQRADSAVTQAVLVSLSGLAARVQGPPV